MVIIKSNLIKDSVKYTTFITEHGRYQYQRTPQGHISSGDAYVRRFDEIIEEVDRKVKIVDDICCMMYQLKTVSFIRLISSLNVKKMGQL